MKNIILIVALIFLLPQINFSQTTRKDKAVKSMSERTDAMSSKAVKLSSSIANSNNIKMQSRNKNWTDKINRNYQLSISILKNHGKIPVENFNKKLKEGYYNANIILTKEFSVSGGEKITVTKEATIYLENDTIVRIFIENDSNQMSDYPSRFKTNSVLKNGLVEYVDFDNNTSTIIVLSKPYAENVEPNMIMPKTKTGKILLYTKKSKSAGDLVFVQIMKGNDIIEEIALELKKIENPSENDCSIVIPFGYDYYVYSSTKKKYLKFCKKLKKGKKERAIVKI